MVSESANGKSLGKLYIAGTGMITPVGDSTAVTSASVKAGINQYKMSSYQNHRSQPMITAQVPPSVLSPLVDELQASTLSEREKKLVQMAAPALNSALENYPLNEPIALFLAGPESLPNSSSPVSTKIIKLLATQARGDIDLRSSRYFATGRAGVLEAIDLAFIYLESVEAPYVLVGGVDSYLDAATLGWMDSQDRVLAEGNEDSFAPGEGAAFLLLSRQAMPDGNGVEVAVNRPGLGAENGHIYSDEPYLGEGLSNAFSRAIANGDGKKVSTIFSSMNGENFFAKEFGVATMRNSSHLQEGYRHEHPADCYGDLGAATGAVLICLSQRDIRGSKAGLQQLVYCSSDLANRAAVCLSRTV